MRISKIIIEISVEDDTSRMRWDGGPLASKAAHSAMFEAVSAAQNVVTDHDFHIVRTGYGATAKDYE